MDRAPDDLVVNNEVFREPQYFASEPFQPVKARLLHVYGYTRCSSSRAFSNVRGPWANGIG